MPFWIRAAQLKYLETPIRIRIATELTRMFLSNMGVRQGCPHSPAAFAIYMQLLHTWILESQEELDLPTLLTIKILLLLFADDILLLNKTPEGLQKFLRVMETFCERTYMVLNVLKTVVVVFNPKDDKSIPNFIWLGHILRREQSAAYLGMMLHVIGKFHQAKQEHIDAAIKSSYSIHSKAISRHFLHTIPIVEYYRSCVLLDKILYAAAVWAVGCSHKGWTKLEKVQKDYFKSHFNLHQRCPSLLLWADSGIFPVQVETLIITVQFLQQLKKLSQDRLPKIALNMLRT